MRDDFRRPLAVTARRPIEPKGSRRWWRAPGVICRFATPRRPRSQNDYLEIAREHHSVLLSKAPKMLVGNARRRRFTWLIDVLYDHSS